MKVAIVHDWLVSLGGGEKIVLQLHSLFPDAPIYTSVYNKKKMDKYFGNMDIRTSFIQKLPFAVKKHRSYLPFMPLAFEEFNLNEYDLVISSSSCCSKGVNISSGTTHICYCHTPMRYAWDMYWDYNKNGNIIKRAIIANQLHKIRMWDYLSSKRVDYFIANSKYIAKRIKKHYEKDSFVIYPAISNTFYKENKEKTSNDYYLLITRMVSYKKADVVVQAFNELNLPLIVIGDGPEKKKIMKTAKENIIFKQETNEEKIKQYYDNSKAFVFIAEEDFGMVMAEAQACGKPVIAYNKGGATEIVENGKTGILIGNQEKETLKQAVLQMEKDYKKFDKNYIRENAKKFSEDNFKKQILEIVNKVMKENK